jgi:hypothetical protein
MSSPFRSLQSCKASELFPLAVGPATAITGIFLVIGLSFLCIGGIVIEVYEMMLGGVSE